MNSLSIDQLLSKNIVMITGKGGIGKSLVTASLGQLAAESGLRTLLIESSSQEQLAPLFGHEPVGHEEVQVGENLNCINLDPTRCFEEYIVKQLGQKKLFERVFSNNVVKTFLNTIPGLGESMLLGRIFYTCELADPLPYDIVLFDAPASGHMQSLMTTPDAIISSGIGGPLVREISRVRGFLADPRKVGTVVVAVPEELVVSEVLDFLPRMALESPAQIMGVLINRTVSKDEVDALSAIDDENFKQQTGRSTEKPRANTVDSSMSESLNPENLRESSRIIKNFLQSRYQRSLDNQSMLISSLSKLQCKGLPNGGVSYGMLPELGMVKEPLVEGFGRDFFKGLMHE